MGRTGSRLVELAERGASSLLVRLLLFPLLVVTVAGVGVAVLALRVWLLPERNPSASSGLPPVLLVVAVVCVVVSATAVFAYYRLRYPDAETSVRALLSRHPLRIPLLTGVVSVCATVVVVAAMIGFLLFALADGLTPTYLLSCDPVTATTPVADAVTLSSFSADQRPVVRRAIETGQVVEIPDDVSLPGEFTVRHLDRTYRCTQTHGDL